jgi:purine-binding chemotaxis protein CheW
MHTPVVIPETGATAEARAGKYLTFRLGGEEFGIRVMQVREIMGLQEITPVPHTPVHVKGVINLRGKVIPVICLRSKFGVPAAEIEDETNFISYAETSYLLGMAKIKGAIKIVLDIEQVMKTLGDVVNRLTAMPVGGGSR